MSDWLIITGEVQINIRYLIPVEAKESFERNIMTVLIKWRTNIQGNLCPLQRNPNQLPFSKEFE